MGMVIVKLVGLWALVREHPKLICLKQKKFEKGVKPVKKDFRKLEDKLSNLTDLKEPERDLWPEISEKSSLNAGGKRFDLRFPSPWRREQPLCSLAFFLVCK
jgi:hypothetical protein